MSAKLLTGKEPADLILRELEPRARELHPMLVIVQVGNRPESNAYIQAKIRASETIGIACEHRTFPETAAIADLIGVVRELNTDNRVSGFIVQLPLPDHLWKGFPEIVRAMDPAKDVDGFTAQNIGNVALGAASEHLPPATPAGVIALLEHYEVSIAGKHAVVVGRSNLVGKPLALMFLNRSATVTVCHSHTRDLALHTRQADIVIAAVGKPGLITTAMVKPGAVVVDVGITRLRPSADSGGQARITGDVDFDAVKEIASAITPVPGGVGPMTVAMLLRNVVRAKERQII